MLAASTDDLPPPTMNDTSVAVGTRPAQVSPIGVVYTTQRAQVAGDHYLITVCIANIGTENAAEVNVTFALSQPDAAITALHAPSAPSEVSSGQARVIIRDIPPGRQVQVKADIRSGSPLRTGQPDVMVLDAYRLTQDDPKLVCAPSDATPSSAETIEAQFIFSGEPITASRAAAALETRLRSLGATAAARPGLQDGSNEAVVSSTTLRVLLIALGALTLTLLIVFFVRARRRWQS